MNQFKTKFAAALAGGAAIVTFGAGVPAHAAGGANAGCGAYCPSGVGLPSGNGYGNANEHANANGLPGAGTVGNADSKFPPGQAPDGSDHNNGYECDGNGGVGQTNPAHTGCAPVYPPPSTGGY